MSMDICKYCKQEEIDWEEPQHKLCHTCLTEHAATWHKMDLDYLSRN
jgi:hypothetical protein